MHPFDVGHVRPRDIFGQSGADLGDGDEAAERGDDDTEKQRVSWLFKSEPRLGGRDNVPISTEKDDRDERSSIFAGLQTPEHGDRHQNDGEVDYGADD